MEKLKGLGRIIVQDSDIGNYIACIGEYLRLTDKAVRNILSTIMELNHWLEKGVLIILDIELIGKITVKKFHKFNHENARNFEEVRDANSFFEAWRLIRVNSKPYPDFYIISPFEKEDLNKENLSAKVWG